MQKADAPGKVAVPATFVCSFGTVFFERSTMRRGAHIPWWILLPAAVGTQKAVCAMTSVGYALGISDKRCPLSWHLIL